MLISVLAEEVEGHCLANDMWDANGTVDIIIIIIIVTSVAKP